MDLKEKKEKREALAKKARRIIDTVYAECRGLTKREEEELDKLTHEIDQLGEEIRAAEALDSCYVRERMPRLDPGNGPPRVESVETRFTAKLSSDHPFERYLRLGPHGITADEFNRLAEARDLSVGSGGGGYLVVPEAISSEIIRAIEDDSPLYRSVRHFRLNQALKFAAPVLLDPGDDPTWTTELDSGEEDTALAVGKRTLDPNALAKRVLVSERLMRLAPQVEPLVREAIVDRFTQTYEKAICTGSGAGEPLGLFTASEFGLDTDRDFTVGSGSISADKLIEAMHQLKPQYLRRAVWIFSRTAMAAIRQLKASTSGMYLLAPAGLGTLGAGTLLDRPVIISEYCPATLSNGNYVGMLCDLSYYWFVEVLPLRIQRLEELYAKTGQIGFHARAEADGAPVLPEAFLRLKLSSS